MKKLIKIILFIFLMLIPFASFAQKDKSSSSNLNFSAGGWYGVDFELLRPVEMTHNGYMTYEAAVGFQTDPSDNCAYAQAFPDFIIASPKSEI